MRRTKLGRFLVFLLIFSILMLNSAQAVFAVEIDDVDPTAPAPPPGYMVMKVSPAENGTFTSLDGFLTVNIYDYNGTQLSWSSNITVYMVYVKGGPEPGGIMYDYHPDGSKGETGLSIPGGYGISHVTFYYKVELTTSVTVLKAWNDANNQDGIRPPSVSVQLKADGVDYETAVTLDSNNSWTHTWPSLPKYDDGTEIVYTVEETPVPTGYTVGYSVNEAGAIVVTNTHIPETTSVTVLKAWNDANNRDGIRPPSVSVQLKADGVDYETAVTLDSNNSWTHTWPSLPKYDDGKEIVYTVEETPVPTGYTVAYSVGDDGVRIITNNRINDPSLAISKLVENVTQGSPQAALTSSIVGDTVRYTVVVTNNGNATLVDVYLTDDEALVGSPVEIEGMGATVWLAGPGGLAMVNLGDMDPGDSIQITYLYDVVASDLDREIIINTATATGEMLPAPGYPEGAILEVDDEATVTVEDVPLVSASILLTKQVENLTQDGIKGELSGGYVGDVFRFTLVITNDGTADLTNIVLTDDMAAAGSPVKNVTAGTDHVWLADGSNPVYLNLPDMAPGDSITLTYDYTTSAADMDGVRINKAMVSGVATITLDDPEPIVVESDDTAALAVDEIPQTGESGTWPVWGIGLLMAALGLTILRRRSWKVGQNA